MRSKLRFGVLALLLLASLASGTILRVPEDFPAIQPALDASADNDTVLVARGTWTGLYISPVHSLTLCSSYLFSQDSTDINETILDGEYAGTILDIVTNADETLTVRGFTMIHGQGTRPGGAAHCDKGGAINMEGTSNACIQDMVFRDCQAPQTAAILNHGDVCGVDSRGRLTIRNIACYNNRITAPTGGVSGCINVRSSHNVLTIDGVYYDGGDTNSNPFYISTSRMDSMIVNNTHVVNSTFDHCSFWSSVTSRCGLRFENVSVLNEQSGGGGNLAIQTGYYDIDTSFVQMKNIEISGPSRRQEGCLYIRSGATHLDIDSLSLHQSRGSSMLINATQRGTLRHLDMHDNVSGDSTSQMGGTLLRLLGMDLVDSHVYNNRVILPPNPDPAGTGGNAVAGAMVRADVGKLRFENLIFENNRVEDLDDYSNHSPTYSYSTNAGRELFSFADTIHAENILVRNSRQPNPTPEVIGGDGVSWTYPGSVIVLGGYSVTARNLLLEDCDDGGLVLNGETLLVENAVLRNVARQGIRVSRLEDPLWPPHYRFRNIHIENVIGRDMYLPPQWQPLSVQSAFFVDVVGSSGGEYPVLDLDNVTVTGCANLRHLFNFFEPVTLNVRNSLFWNNAYTQFVEWDDPITQEWTFNLVQEAVPGEGNLVGLNPNFDPELGAPFLAANSPCIDAGNLDPAWNDVEDLTNPGFALWPSQGSLRNDIGYTGGPHASLAPDTSWSVLIPWEPRTTPQDFSLGAPWPNPFNPVTQIPFTLARPTHTRLSVHNLLGQEVAVLVDRSLPTGKHHVAFHSGTLASGVYLVTLEAAGRSETRTVTLLR